tara:strand:+ start:1375 stop:1782 length:408 start_codon:yes stop_codon:yes gene_type:complete
MVNESSVLFLCVHNAGRSQIGAGWMRHLGGETIQAYSAGSTPAEQVNPMVVKAMAEVGIDLTNQKPTKWTEDMIKEVDVVISMGCGDTCPVYPNKSYINWEIDDPSGQEIETVRTVRDQIEKLVRELLVKLLGKE